MANDVQRGQIKKCNAHCIHYVMIDGSMYKHDGPYRTPMNGKRSGCDASHLQSRLEKSGKSSWSIPCCIVSHTNNS